MPFFAFSIHLIPNCSTFYHLTTVSKTVDGLVSNETRIYFFQKKAKFWPNSSSVGSSSLVGKTTLSHATLILKFLNSYLKVLTLHETGWRFGENKRKLHSLFQFKVQNMFLPFQTPRCEGTAMYLYSELGHFKHSILTYI